MFGTDIKLNIEGKSIMKNNDFATEDDDLKYIIRLLVTPPGGWKLHTNLGIGLQDFVGRDNTEENAHEMIEYISEKLYTYAIMAKIEVNPLNEQTVQVIVSAYTEDAIVPINFKFNYRDGKFSYFDVPDDEDIEEAKLPVLTNKYYRRRV